MGDKFIFKTDIEELYHDKGALCPYCEHLNERDGTQEEFFVDDEYIYQCEHCGREFRLITQVIYSYYTSKLEEV